MLISIAIVTYNRFELFQKCINAVLKTTENVEKEIIIWDNASKDNTISFIKELENKFTFIKPFFSEKNIGVNAKSMSVILTKGDYIIGIDDDVIDFESGWVDKMINAFNSVKELGYLALDVVQDEFTNGAKPPKENYEEKIINKNVTLEYGPVGGWCFMIPRYVYEKVGKLRQCKKSIFFSEESDYIIRCEMKGYSSAILKNVKCYHATGPYFNKKYQDIYDSKLKQFTDDKDFYKFKRKIKYKIFKIRKKLLK
ncbi:MAG TPA: glycosyltransferase [Ignavibacteria bacterium]